MKVLPQQLRLYAVTDRTWLNGHRRDLDGAAVRRVADGGVGGSHHIAVHHRDGQGRRHCHGQPLLGVHDGQGDGDFMLLRGGRDGQGQGGRRR